MTEPWRLSAAEVAAAVAARQLSCVEVVQSHLDRIAAVNPKVNAICRVLADEALAAAAAQDVALAGGAAPGPLAGVPMTVKENIDLARTPTTLGVRAFANDMPTGDAPHVAQLKAAGAIPIGRTNLPDYALRWHTENELHGLTRNPWDQDLTCGGSSGGDGAALASGMTPLGLGNDIAGSVRWPSQCCGTVALKPTRGRVPRTRMVDRPVARGLASQMFAVHGPMTRHARDLRLAIANMSAYSPLDPTWVPAPIEGPAMAQPVRVAVLVDPGAQGVAPEIADGVRKAARALVDAGYVVEEVQPPDMRRSVEIYWQLMGDLTAATDPSALGASFLHYREAFAPHYDEVRGEPAADPWSDRLQLATRWAQWMDQFPLVLAPVATQPAWPVGYDERGGDDARDWLRAVRMIVVVNLFGLPSVALPTHVAGGVPQGVQVIGRAFREDLCIAAAEAIEERLGSFTPIDPAW
jgi:amidase